MKLTTLEKILLRLVAQDEDYERLEWIPGELKEHFPGKSDEAVIDVAKKALGSLLEKKLVRMYRERFKDGNETSAYQPLDKTSAMRAIADSHSWVVDYSAETRYSAMPTDEGVHLYRTASRIEGA